MDSRNGTTGAANNANSAAAAAAHLAKLHQNYAQNYNHNHTNQLPPSYSHHHLHSTSSSFSSSSDYYSNPLHDFHTLDQHHPQYDQDLYASPVFFSSSYLSPSSLSYPSPPPFYSSLTSRVLELHDSEERRSSIDPLEYEMSGVPQQPLDSIFDRLRASSGANGGLSHPPRPSSNPQFGHSGQQSQRSSYGTLPQQAYGAYDYNHARQSSNDSLLQTLESAINSQPSLHHSHAPRYPTQQSFSPQPQYASIDSQALGNYSPTATTQLNRQLGPEQHGRPPSGDRDAMVPQNYLINLLKNKSDGGNNVGLGGSGHSSHGRRSVDNIPQLPQRFEAFREGARSTGLSDNPGAPKHHSLPATGQPLTAHDLVSTLLSKDSISSAKHQEAVASAGHGVLDHRGIMSPPPREANHNVAQDLLHQILGRGKPVQDDVNIASVMTHPHKQPSVESVIPTSPRLAPETITHIPDTAPEAAEEPISHQAPKAPLFTYVNPFDQLAKTAPHSQSPKPPSITNGSHSPALGNTAGLSTPSNIPLPFSPPPQHFQEEAQEVISEQNPSFLPAGEAEQYLERHTPPLTQPYVEDAVDAFGNEADPFEAETDPFEANKVVSEEDVVSGEGSVEPVTVIEVVETAEILERATEDADDSSAAQGVEEVIVESTEVVIVEASASSISADGTPDAQSAVMENGFVEAEKFSIYKFPMKPFSQITFAASPTISLPKEGFSDIARMTREADQMDRNLISASKYYITYAMAKSKGGVRIIRQEDGRDVVLMKNNLEPTVNVSLGCEEQALAVGTNGTVLWAELEGEMTEADLEARSILFPPTPLQNGGLTKSRTHLSSSHPRVFAIGRGKFISIIHADVARQYCDYDGGIAKVRDEAYHANHSRIIDTGKVSKEFCFSEDDTALVTIDKAGKIKLWDISRLVDFEPNEDGLYSSETPKLLTEPALTLSAVSPGEPYKATSVIFVDKQPPYERRQALRYLVIGLQQNHVIQLWDIAIGRAVQELRFPVSSGNDGLCSLSYHPKTGVIVVGNPNRNTVSFIHLSTPKYNLQPFSQAGFVKAIAERSPNLPRLDATAIMSSVVEYTLGDRGRLISVEVLDSASPEDAPGGGKAPVFELYISHTKGMTCLSLSKEDIGFDGNMRVMKGLDAVASGACTIAPLPAPVIPPPVEPTKTEEKPVVVETPENVKPTVQQGQQQQQQQQQQHPQQQQPLQQQQPQGKARAVVEVLEEPPVEKLEEKPVVTNGQGKKAAAAAGAGRGKKVRRDVNTVSFAGPSNAGETEDPPPTPQPKKNKGKDREEKKVTAAAVSVSPELLEREIKKIEEAVNASFSQVLSKEINTLYRKFDDDRRVQQASADAKQEAVLRMVSSTLVSGMEPVLDKVMLANINAKVIPEIRGVLLEHLGAAIPDTVSRGLDSIIPKAVEKALSSRNVLGGFTESILNPIRQDIDDVVRSIVQPAVEKMVGDVAKAFALQLSKHSKDMFKEMRRVHEEDSLKIAQLTSTVSDLTKQLAAMEAATSRILEAQEQLLANQEKLAEAAAATAAAAVAAAVPHPSNPPTPATARSEAELLGDEIENCLRRGDFETGVVTWLQSKDMQEYYFDQVISKFNPYEVVPRVGQVVALTIAASVTGNLEKNVDERLNWLEACLNDFHTIREENTESMLPRITAVLISRLQQFYMVVAEENPGARILKRVAYLSRITNQLMQAVS